MAQVNIGRLARVPSALLAAAGAPIVASCSEVDVRSGTTRQATSMMEPTEGLVTPQPAMAPEPEPEPDQEQEPIHVMPASSASGGGCPHGHGGGAATDSVVKPEEILSVRLGDTGKLGVGFNHHDTEQAVVVSVVPGSLTAEAGVQPGMLLCRVGTERVGSLPCNTALEVLRRMAAVRPLELGFGWPGDGGEGSAAQQLQTAWSTILSHEVPADAPLTWPDWKQIHAGVVQTDSSPTISCPMDLPLDRSSPQLICPNGAVCRATISWLSTEYSGLCEFGGDAVDGLLRLSSAIEPVNLSSWNPMSIAIGSVSKSKLFPCGAFKSFRGAGIHSGNLLFAGRKVGQQEEEFFAHALCTHATEKVTAPLSIVLDAFKKFSAWPAHSGLSDFAKWNAAGEEETRECTDFPWCLTLQPLLRPDGSGPAGKRLAQEVMGKVQGSGFKSMWAVLNCSEGTLCAYGSQAAAASADMDKDGGSGKMVLPAVALRSVVTIDLPEKYAGQHVLGLQPTGGKKDALPVFIKFGTAEDRDRWLVAVAEASAAVVSDESGSIPPQPVAAAPGDGGPGGETVPPFLEQLAAIPSGTALFDVFACPSPESATRMMQQAEPSDHSLPNQGNPFLLRIGVLRSTSRFVRSTHRLAFRHQRKEEDYARKPGWVDQLDPLHLTVGHKAFEQSIRAGRYNNCG